MKKFASFFLLAVVILFPAAVRLIMIPYFDIYNLISMTALTSFALLSIQFILSARIGFLDAAFGHDKLIQAHRLSGITAVILLLAHGPLYLISRIQMDGGLFLDLPYELPIVGGSVSYLLLLLVAAGAAFRVNLGIKYDSWKKMHRVTYVLYPLFFFHAMVLGSTIASSPAVFIYMIVMFVAVLAAWAWRAGMYFGSRRKPYLLSTVDKLNYNVHQFSFAGKSLDHKPGQFAYLSVVKNGVVQPAHPFTISSSPINEDLQFTIKSSGDFTAELPELTPGSEAYVQGPFGVFSHKNVPTEAPLLFIAGGVGITPFLSMLRLLSQDEKDRDIVLVWANRSEADLFLLDELAHIDSTMSDLKILHVFSDSMPEKSVSDHQKSGYVDGDLLAETVADISDRQVFVCGPPVMRDKVVSALVSIGVKRSNIHAERFGL